MTLVPGTRIGAYEVRAVLGAGGMGEVYRAQDSKLKRDVALKVLPAAFAGTASRIARFQREAELLASLNHPGIAQVYGLEEFEGAAVLVMELVDGEDLSHRIARGPIPIPEALEIARQIAMGLEAAHERGIIHRDLKPANIKLRADGSVKILDFGLAKSLAPAGDDTPTLTAVTSPGVAMGTPAYMSPEQARGEQTGPETDVWAFGVVLYEMLTGVSPFARPSTTETLARVLTASPDDSRLPEGLPAGAARLLRNCLERDTRKRWHHMGDAAIVIGETLDSPDAAREAAAVTPVPRRGALVLGGVALAALAAGFGGGMFVERRQAPDRSPVFKRLTFRRGLIRSARFAPDGETILYSALWDDEPCRIHTVRVDSPESRPLDLPNASVLAVSRSGELALSLGSHNSGILTYGTLARVPIAGGAPRQILQGVKFADWSLDGAELAIIRGIDGRDRLEFPIGNVLFDPGSERDSRLGFVRVSPDGQRAAFVQYTSELNGRIMVVDRSGAASALSRDYVNIHGLSWKGEEVLYTAAEDRPLFRILRSESLNGVSRTLMRMPVNVTLWDARPDGRLLIAQTDDRSVLVVRVRGETRERELSWLDASWVNAISPDGKTILFTEYGLGGGPKGGVYLRGTDGSPAVRLGDGRGAGLSPDGQWVAALDRRYPSPYIEILPTGAGESRKFANEGLEYYSGQWLPDGKRIVVSGVEPGMPLRLYIHDLSSARPKPITPEGVNSWAISPDGSTIAVRGLGPGIRLYTVDSGASHSLPRVSEKDIPVGWIAGGLLTMRPGDPASPAGQIYRIDIATGQASPWINIRPQDPAGIMGHLSFYAAPDGQSYAFGWHRALSSLYIADVA